MYSFNRSKLHAAVQIAFSAAPAVVISLYKYRPYNTKVYNLKSIRYNPEAKYKVPG